MTLLTLLACTGPTPDPGVDPNPIPNPDQTDESDSGVTGGDSGVADTWVALSGPCEAPNNLSPQPLRKLGEDQHTQTQPREWFVELVDVEINSDNTLAWGAGQGGVMVYDITDPRAPQLRDHFPPEGIGRFYRVELLEDHDLVYATHRDLGMVIIDASDPDDLTQVTFMEGAGMEGMARVGDRLYVANLSGGLMTFDISTPRSPELVHTAEWEGSAWDVKVDVDAQVAYLPDNRLGIIPVDLSNPDQPVPKTPVDIGGAAQDIALGEGVLYAAAGGRGVVVLERSTPLVPTQVGVVDFNSSVQSVELDGDILWATNQQDVIAIDAKAPLAPVHLSTVETPEFAMHVAAKEGIAWVGDWSRLSSWSIDDQPGAAAPDLDLSVKQLFLKSDGDMAHISLRNTGAAPLSLLGAESGDERLSVHASRTIVPPGEEATLELRYTGGDEALLTALCVVSDDPDSPTTLMSVHTGGGGQNPAIGEPAPDFALRGLDGETYQLSEQLGRPVVLAYFATW
ncbi:MAG: hypothetical protein AAFV53_14525 [Myxococcota bacterium]